MVRSHGERGDGDRDHPNPEEPEDTDAVHVLALAFVPRRIRVLRPWLLGMAAPTIILVVVVVLPVRLEHVCAAEEAADLRPQAAARRTGAKLHGLLLGLALLGIVGLLLLLSSTSRRDVRRTKGGGGGRGEGSAHAGAPREAKRLLLHAPCTLQSISVETLFECREPPAPSLGR